MPPWGYEEVETRLDELTAWIAVINSGPSGVKLIPCKKEGAPLVWPLDFVEVVRVNQKISANGSLGAPDVWIGWYTLHWHGRDFAPISGARVQRVTAWSFDGDGGCMFMIPGGKRSPEALHIWRFIPPLSPWEEAATREYAVWREQEEKGAEERQQFLDLEGKALRGIADQDARVRYI